MKKIISLLLMGLCCIAATAQVVTWNEAIKTKSARVDVVYLSNPPFMYQDANGNLAGIEYDILQAFAAWAQKEKGVTLDFRFINMPTFDLVLNKLSGTKGPVIGAATIAITEKRGQVVNFSSPYLRNKSMLITSGEIPSLVYSSELKTVFADLQAVTIQGTLHEKAINALKKEYLKNLRITFVNNPDDVMKVIGSDAQFFGYVDAVSYWNYIHKNKDSFTKIQRVGEQGEEFFGLAFPKKSDWNLAFSAFFDSGFGFTATKEYRNILEKHLGPEIIETVRIRGNE